MNKKRLDQIFIISKTVNEELGRIANGNILHHVFLTKLFEKHFDLVISIPTELLPVAMQIEMLRTVANCVELMWSEYEKEDKE